MTLRIGSLFSGVAGLDMAVAAHYGADVAWHVEFDKHPSAILAHHYPDIPNYGDVTAVDWSQVEPVDIITGGFPCQDVSHAGLRRGVHHGTRSGLWFEMARAIDQLKPWKVVIENVAGLLSADAAGDVEPCTWCLGDEPAGHMRALGAVLADLAEMGFDADWGSVRAADAGAPHGRLRVFIVATARHTGHDAGGTEQGQQPQGATGGPRQSGDDVAPDAARERGDGGGDTGPRRWAEPTDRSADDDDLTLLPTPAVNDMGRGKTVEDWDAWTEAMQAKHGNGNGHGKSLEIEAQRLLPTPTASDARDGAHLRQMTLDAIERGASKGVNLNHLVEGDLPEGGAPLLPTPTSRDHKGRNQRNDTTCLPGAVAADFGPYTAAIRRWEQVTGRPAPSPTEPGANGRPRLSPRFVEWMMGLPDGWVTGVGIPRSAQLKALGNGVVPQQAALALAMLDGDEAAVPPPLPDGAQLLGTPNAHERTHTPRQVASGIQLANQIDELVNGADR